MFVLIKVDAGMCGTEDSTVYKFNDGTSLDDINDYAADLSVDHYNMYEHDDIDVEPEYSYSYEVLDLTEEEVEEEYGGWCNA